MYTTLHNPLGIAPSLGQALCAFSLGGWIGGSMGHYRW